MTIQLLWNPHLQIIGLKLPWNEQLQKTPGGGASALVANTRLKPHFSSRRPDHLQIIVLSTRCVSRGAAGGRRTLRAPAEDSFQPPQHAVQVRHGAQVGQAAQPDASVMAADEFFQPLSVHPERSRRSPERPPRSRGRAHPPALREAVAPGCAGGAKLFRRRANREPFELGKDARSVGAREPLGLRRAPAGEYVHVIVAQPAVGFRPQLQLSRPEMPERLQPAELRGGDRRVGLEQPGHFPSLLIRCARAGEAPVARRHACSPCACRQLVGALLADAARPSVGALLAAPAGFECTRGAVQNLHFVVDRGLAYVYKYTV